MSKIAILFAVLMIVGAMYNPNVLPVTRVYADTTDVNPNKSSELSLLMRQMYDHAAEARRGVAERKNISYPKSFLNINTAKPTDAQTKNEYYATFADLYLQTLETYESSNDANRVKNYNNVINACLACHSSHCPGPVPKIKKLILPIN
jgi:hypothetical protein